MSPVPTTPKQHVSADDVLAQLPLSSQLQSAGEMGTLAVTTLREAVRPPFSWIPDAIVESSRALRRCLIPLAISMSVYLIGFGIILFGIILVNLGAAEREAGGLYIAWIREVSTWITMMIFAGVAGSAVAADLGARKIREELDALSVLGVDKIRALVVPRVAAMTVSAVVLALIGLLITLVVNYVVAPSHLAFPRGVFIDNTISSILPIDLYASVFKHAILGFFVGIVSCQKGLSARGGAEGVGRAVNQTVVVTFFGIWLLNSVFELAYLTMFPDASVLRG